MHARNSTTIGLSLQEAPFSFWTMNFAPAVFCHCLFVRLWM